LVANLSHVFAGQNVGVTQVGDHVRLVTFMHYDLGYFDDEAGLGLRVFTTACLRSRDTSGSRDVGTRVEGRSRGTARDWQS